MKGVEQEPGSKVRPWTGGLELLGSQETGREPGMPWCALGSVMEEGPFGMKLVI